MVWKRGTWSPVGTRDTESVRNPLGQDVSGVELEDIYRSGRRAYRL